jgi:hypothetical protein
MCIRNGTVNTCYDEQKPPCVRDHFCNPDFFVLAAMSQSAPKKKTKKNSGQGSFLDCPGISWPSVYARRAKMCAPVSLGSLLHLTERSLGTVIVK